ncbi:CAP domain-containing protein [Schaalia odontolytica]|uniref:CAP domain-containing protein n=1 Tax=Schaalia odontolytica TaxID=1660 RepID=UPI00210E144D|nr:CAP domain-containing protein [Schaalia odontolytica]MCQ5281060.1 CAP domain-containing protein [Schaalia odontolytica]
MSFQLTRTHTSVVLAATTIAASLVVIPTLAEGNATSGDAFCNALSGAEGRITAEYNPLLASYASAAAGNSSAPALDPARESELRAALADAQAALESAQQAVLEPTASAGEAAPAADTVSRGLDWVDWSQVDDATQARIIEALIIQKMNAYRANAGLPELVVSDTVTTDARAWSKHMSDSDDFNHDPDYKYFGAGKLDGGDTTYAGENIAYNHRENFGDKWGAYGSSKNPMQAADALFDQWKNSSGHDKNMLAQNNVVGVGVHIAKHGNFTRIYGTQKFYAVTGGSPNVSRFHTTGDTASAYGFDGAAFNADNTNYVSGLAGGGDAQRANSWQNKVGSLPGVALPVDVSSLPAKAGSAAPATSTPAPADTAPSADRQQAVIDAQTSVNAAQAALDEYLASAEESKPAASLADIDAELDRVAESIASQTAVRPEKDGGVTLQGGENAGRYLTATEYRDALTRCTTLSVEQDGNNPSVGDGAGSTPDQQTPSDEAPALANGDENPSVGQEPGQTPAPSVPSAAPSAPANGDGNPSVTPSAPANGGGNPSAAPSAPANGDTTPAAPETNAPADDQGTVTARVDITPSADPTQASTPASQNASTPTQARADALAATGASSVWVGVGAVAVLVAGAGAVVASRRAKR